VLQPGFCVYEGLCYLPGDTQTCYRCQIDVNGQTVWDIHPGRYFLHSQFKQIRYPPSN